MESVLFEDCEAISVEMNPSSDSNAYLLECYGSEFEYVACYVEFSEAVRDSIRRLRDHLLAGLALSPRLDSLSAWFYDFEVFNVVDITLGGREFEPDEYHQVAIFNNQEVLDNGRRKELCFLVVSERDFRIEFHLKHDDTLMATKSYRYETFGI